jgi:hypothetical protein
MGAFKDLTGQKFGMLEFIKFVRMNKKPTYQYAVWECKCDCGNVVEVQANSVTTGRKGNCGCQTSEISRKGWDKRGRKHSLSEHPLYDTWSGMISRCYKPQLKAYADYGARGIRICDEWLNEPQKFIDHMLESGWKPGLTVDRIDVNGNYCPENVRAADGITQANNTRRNIYLELNGERRTVAEWAKIKGLPYGTILSRVQRGWEAERTLNTPKQRRKS